MQLPVSATLWLLGLLLALPACAASDVTGAPLAADHAAWQSAREDYRQRLAAGDLAADEAEAYRSYLETLQARVAAGCRALALRGAPPPAGVECPAPGAATGPATAGGAPPAVAPTREERAEALDRELGRGLGEFDELLLREQARVRAAAPRDAAAAAAGGGTAGGSGPGTGAGQAGGEAAAAGGAPPGTTSDGTPAGGQPGGAGSGPVAGSGQTGEGGLGAGGQPGAASAGRPADIPDGSDDDVVARQLREAAEQETDPELKARLWDEYRKYKQGTR